MALTEWSDVGWGAAAVCLLGSLALAGPMETSEPPPVDAAAAFERLKTLQGTWEAPVGTAGQKATSTFELVADGSVLLERYHNPALPAGGRMVSAYHLDEGALVLTHYCIAKNQPTLKAERIDPATGAIQFEFLRAGSLPDPNAGHMRRAMYRIDTARTFTTEWEYFVGGKKTMTEVETFTRVTQETR